MGFATVYQTLLELFPQVDTRLLKAAAIEHSKDPDAAVESILTDVLPFVTHQPLSDKSQVDLVDLTSSTTSILDSTSRGCLNALDVVNDGDRIGALELVEPADSADICFYDATDIVDLTIDNPKNEEFISTEIGQQSTLGTICDNSVTLRDSMMSVSSKSIHNSTDGSSETESVPANEGMDGLPDLRTGGSSDAPSTSSNVEIGTDDLIRGHSDGCNKLPLYDLNKTPGTHDDGEQLISECDTLNHVNATDYDANSGEGSLPDLLNHDLLQEPESGILTYDVEHHEMNNYMHDEFVKETNESEPVIVEDDTSVSTIVTRSGQVCSVSLLKDIIEDGKSNKEMLLSAMESVVKLVKQVELEENAAELAKEDAANGGLEILEKVDEIKMMLKRAKEANNMHAGEVYGEKSILATEVRELQNRLLGLSDEKDKYLSLLDEMQKSLETRLALAEEVRREAELQKLEKEEIARRALDEQELIMEKVVKESKILLQEAEDNAKLRDFLMEKGREVDMLQGEISVICQDVKSLKDNFDNCIPLSKSFSLKQTSVKLASSKSSVKSLASVKSMASDSTSEHVELPESPYRMSRSPSVGCHTPRSNVSEEQTVGAGVTASKELSDDDWELFDF